MVEGVIVVQFGVDDEAYWLIRKLLYRRPSTGACRGGLWQVSMITGPSSVTTKLHVEFAVLGRINVNAILDFGESRTEILRLNRNGDRQHHNADGKPAKRTSPNFIAASLLISQISDRRRLMKL